MGLKIDPSESDGVGAVPGDLPDSGSGKTDLGRQKRSWWCWCWCQLGHPRMVKGRGLQDKEKNRAKVSSFFKLTNICVLPNSINLPDSGSGKSPVGRQESVWGWATQRPKNGQW